MLSISLASELLEARKELQSIIESKTGRLLFLKKKDYTINMVIGAESFWQEI